MLLPTEKAFLITFGLLLFVLFLTQAIVFGIFSFHNPDLTANNQTHCYVEPGDHFEPLTLNQTASPAAVDVTSLMLHVFRAQFALSLSLLAIVVIIAMTFYHDASSPRVENQICNKYGCLGMTFLFFVLLASIGVYVYSRITRYNYMVRVCSGDFLVESPKTKVYPYMIKSGTVLWWCTWVRGLAT